MKTLVLGILLSLFAASAFSMTALEKMTKMQSNYCNAKWAYLLSPTAQTFKVYLGYRNKFVAMAGQVANAAMAALEEHPELKASEPVMNTPLWYDTLAMTTYTKQCPDKAT